MNNNQLIYIVDDDDAVRRSVKFMLKHTGFQTREMASGDEFLKNVQRNERGCVLLDIRMPGMDGLEVQEHMNKNGIDMPIIILTGHGDIEIAVKAMRAGALNFIEKPYNKDALLRAIDEAFRHLENNNLKEIAASDANMRLSCLTGRERDVLNGLLQGYPNKTIAFDLGISPRTVEIYRANMMEKLRVKSLAEALRFGFAAEAVEIVAE
ncbi:response regulator transcription factor [Parasphingorhabdus sp.]|uniref:response regulator transcription factor n=1 Tax=Parasphingorhabdus sp. TaxID=2709688 RepID=UPI003A8DAFC1